VTAAGLIVNFAAVPLMTLAQLGAIATVAAAGAGDSGANAAGLVTHLAAYWLVESARIVDAAPWLTRLVPRPGWVLVVLYYSLVLWLLRARRTAWASAAVVVAYTAVVLGPLPAARDADPERPGRLRAVFLDVGQGDATLVTLPDGRSLLVDAGGIPNSAFDIGRRVIAPALLPLGVSRLDELIVTHADADHIGGAPSVFRLFAPLVVREGTPVPPNPDLRALAALADTRGAAWRIVQAGDADRMGSVDVRVWHPPLPDWERQRVRNDDSIVLEFRYGDVSIVLPGDVGREPEGRLAGRLQPAPLLVLKAPHHGSATSSSPPFIRALNPAAVIFSAGRDNPYGHPAPIVVERYRRIGATLFNTADDGAVFVETDGRTVEIRTFEGRRITLERH
jgi:competence protein ComEC